MTTPKSLSAPDKGLVVIHLAIEQLDHYPLLERISLVNEASASLLGTHHGDPGRKERGQELAEDWAAWVEEIRQNGVREPLRVIRRPVGEADCRPLPGYWVVDGRHRLAACAEIGKTVLPCIEISEDDAKEVIDGMVIARRHCTKSQRAWFAVILHPEVAGDVHGKIGKNRPAVAAGLIAQPELAARFGVSERLLRDAIELYRGLEKYPQHRDRFEPSIWGGASLEHVLRGFNAIDAGTSGPSIPAPRHPPQNIRKAWASEQAASHNWRNLPSEVKSNFERDLRLYSESLAPDYFEWKMAILSEIAAEKGVGA